MATVVQNINISEIDTDIIKMIRPLNTDSDDYKILKAAIEKDGQRHPITVRELTDEEKSKVTTDIKYGIIDGHHRFHIAKELDQITIMAEIDQNEVSHKMDIILAYRLNESTIKMSTLDKGKVLYELLKTESDDSTNDRKKLRELGKEVFGIGTAMSYRALQEYKKSIGEETQKKPPKSVTNLDFKKFKEQFKESSKLITREIKISDVTNCADRVEVIDKITKELLILKKYLMLQTGVEEEISRRKNVSSDVPSDVSPTNDFQKEVEVN